VLKKSSKKRKKLSKWWGQKSSDSCMMKVTNRILCREGGLRRAEDRFGRPILCDDERIDNGTETRQTGLPGAKRWS
jgi:hypothetical protein